MVMGSLSNRHSIAEFVVSCSDPGDWMPCMPKNPLNLALLKIAIEIMRGRHRRWRSLGPRQTHGRQVLVERRTEPFL